MNKRQIGNLVELSSTSGYIHKKGTDTYAKALILLPSDTIDMYEEVGEMPPYTKGEYDEKVAELVRERYSESEEFAIQRKAINAAFTPAVANAEAAMSEYATYNSYVEECKSRAKEMLAEVTMSDYAPGPQGEGA